MCEGLEGFGTIKMVAESYDVTPNSRECHVLSGTNQRAVFPERLHRPNILVGVMHYITPAMM